MNFLARFAAILYVTVSASLAQAAALPTEFVVASDSTSFHPAIAFRKGDRLQVQSPHLDHDDIVALGRCLDAGCANMDIVRAWSGSRHRVRDYVNIQHDGDYVFFGSRVPNGLPEHERRGCFRSVPLNKVCSEAVRLTIRDSKTSDEVFRVQFSSDSWFWVRKIRAAH